ncbi:hypothetical protein [Leucobacter sp. G161]|uniref:hypothetical protein n=1 Tax=Leucobacter sp. G161 TaxID=663704 RepID=UPI00073D01A7|nr:hypothetical protein [Leucobacter sp. G161]KUF07244.1 hypothetical protein AUL38_10245 [Leucobacter sp. G161]
MSDNTLLSWYARVTEGASINEVSRKAGIPVATLHRQLGTGKFSPDTCANVGRAFGNSAIEALLVHGLLVADDLDGVVTIGTLNDATDQALLEEIGRRLDHVAEGESPVFDEPAPHVDDLAQRRNVRGAGDNAETPDDDHVGESWEVADEPVAYDGLMAAKKGKRQADELPHAE